MTSERVFTPEQIEHRILCATMKTAVKAEAITIRAHRRSAIGKARDGMWLSILQAMKAKARARLLIYGFVRGKDWERTESKHDRPVNAWTLRQVWNETREEAAKTLPADHAYTNDLIKKYVK